MPRPVAPPPMITMSHGCRAFTNGVEHFGANHASIPPMAHARDAFDGLGASGPSWSRGSASLRASAVRTVCRPAQFEPRCSAIEVPVSRRPVRPCTRRRGPWFRSNTAAGRSVYASRSAWNCINSVVGRCAAVDAQLVRSAIRRRPPWQSTRSATSNAMPSSAARAMWASVVPRVIPTMVPRAYGSQCGAPRPASAGTR